VLSPAAPGAQIMPSPSGTEKQVKQMLGGRLRRRRIINKNVW